MPKIVSLPNSAHVQNHSSAALSRESERCAHTGGKPLAPELVFWEGRLAGELGPSSWADGGCPMGVLGGTPWRGPEAERESVQERAQERRGGSGDQAAEETGPLNGGLCPSRQVPLGLGQLSHWVEGGAARPEGA